MMNILKAKKKWLILICLPFILFLFFLLLDRLYPLPIKNLKPTQTILADNGRPLWRFADDNGIWRYPVSLDQVSNYYLEALLTYEDRHFYQHSGIDFFALLRACYQNISAGKIISGGSTISMQVARILEPHERSVFGKLTQIWRTLQLEWHYTKDEILTMYINRAPYGGTLEGVGAASWSYFGKSPNQLTRNEAVVLAVLPQAPSRLRPDRYPDRAQQARDKVLQRLLTYQVWSNEIVDDVMQEEVWVTPRKTAQLAPLLARRLRLSYPAQNIIRSTIDESLQFVLEDMALNWKDQLPPKNSLAILVVDHTNMAVKGYVGSIDFNDNSRFGQVDMIKALRSPGSTLKPFLYGLALNDGMIHSESLLQDVPRVTTNYRPSNFYDGYHGPVSVSEALQRSLNLPAVQLMELYGPTRFTSKLTAAGLSLTSSDNIPNISYILGGVSVRMDQLVSTYAAFARKGNAAPIRFTASEPLSDIRLINEGSAWVIRRILALQQPPMPFQQSSNMATLAWKTGTSYDYRDAWAIGLNARYLIGVWVGRPDGSPAVGQYGNITAVPILQQVNTLLLNKERYLNRLLPVDPMPNSVRIANICWPTGTALADDDSNCHRKKRAWIVNDIIPPTLEQLNSLNSHNYRAGSITVWLNKQGLRVNADCSGAQKKEIALWPIELENWILPQERRASLIPQIDPNCPVLLKSHFSPLLITGIMQHQILRMLPTQDHLTITINSQGGGEQKWLFLDGDLIGEGMNDLTVKITFDSTNNGYHDLLLLDDTGQIDRIDFQVQ